MKIEAGKYYRTRGGHVFGPMVWDKDPTINYPWHIVSTEPEVCWDKRGFWLVAGTSQLDLISEVYVSDTPPDTPLPDIITDQPCKTLRDEFAMEAMKLLIPRHERGTETLAEFAYRQADAMMEARKK
jgi:hypothetical protein